jgi:hypothetical protein
VLLDVIVHLYVGFETALGVISSAAIARLKGAGAKRTTIDDHAIRLPLLHDRIAVNAHRLGFRAHDLLPSNLPLPKKKILVSRRRVKV